MILGWCYQRPSVLGVATGAVAGLATITPAAGYVQPIIGIPIGIAASLIGFYCMAFRSKKTRIDESLDVWAVHGMGGTFGTLAAGFFASLAINAGGRNGLFYRHSAQVLIQLAGIASVWAFAFAMTWGLGKLVDITMGLRVSPTEESVGLDISQHGERAYGGWMR
jgi:Amt family ammonium transporter